jgi:hypothetical protein
VNLIISDSNTPTNTILTENSIYSYNALSQLTFNTLTISHPYIDAGETQTLTAYIYNGVTPYTYNIVVYNSVGMVTSQMATNALTYNTFAFTQNAAWGTGSFTVNLIISDSNTPTNTILTENSIYSYNVLSPLTFNSLKISNSPIFAGQTQTLTTYIYNGVTPYTYKIVVYNSVGVVADQVATNGLTYNTFAFTQNAAWGVGTFAVNLIVADSNTPTNTVLSENSIYIYNAFLPLTFNSFTISNPNVGTGQTQTLTAYIYNGVAPYTYNIVVYNSVGMVTSQMATNALTYNTLAFTQNAAWGTGSFTVNLIIHDSDTPTNSVLTENSIYTYNVLSQLTFNTLTISHPYIDAGETQTLTAYIYNGVTPYTYNIVVYNSVGMVADQRVTNALTYNTFAFTQNTVWGTGTFTVNLIIADSNTPTNTVLSENSIYTYNAFLPLAFNTLTISKPNIDSGQTQTLTAYIYNGVTPYTYNIVVYNSVRMVADQRVTNALTYNTFAFTQNSAWGTGSFTVNLIISDSNTPTNTVLSENSIYTYNAFLPLAFNTLTISNPNIDAGQTQTLTTYIYNGIGPYTYNIMIYNSVGFVTNQIVSNALTFNSFTFTQLASYGTGKFTVNVMVTDSNTPTNSVVTTTLFYTYNGFTTVNTPTITPSPILPNTLDVNTNIKFITSNVGGGNGPYTVNYIVSNSVTNALLLSYQFNSVPAGLNTLIWTIPASLLSMSNTIEVNVIITDSATVRTIANSIYYKTLTVDNALSTPSISPTQAQNGIVIAPNSITFSTTFSGGTPKYTYTWQVYNSVTNAIINTTTYSAVSLTYNTFVFTANSLIVGNTIAANVLVTDSAAIPTSANSPHSGIQKINSGITPLAPSISTPNTPYVDVGQAIVFVGEAGGGTGQSYTYNFIVVNTETGSLFANMLYTNVQWTSNTFTYVTTTANARNTIVANVIVTDTTLSEIANSIKTPAITINPALSTPSISPTLANTITAGNTITFSTTFSGGTPKYTYTWQVYNSTTNAIINTTTHSALSSNTDIFVFMANSLIGGNTIYANVTVSDGASPPDSANSALSGIITVNAGGSTSTTTTTTTTIGGGGSGGGTSGGGGISSSSGGGGGPSGPSVTRSGSCYTISNLTQRSLVNVSLNGISFEIRVNFITPTTAGVTVNGLSYTLSLDQQQVIQQASGNNYTMEMTALSYIPIEDTFSLSVCGPGGQPANATTTITPTAPTATTSNSTVLTFNFTNSSNSISTNLGIWPGTITVSAQPGVSGPVGLHITNVTATESGLPQNYTKLVVLNMTLNSTANVTIEATLHYSCQTNSSRIVLFVLENHTWMGISPVSENACSISFLTPKNRVIALMAANVKPPAAPTNTVVQRAQSASGSYKEIIEIFLVMVFVVAIVMFIYLRKRRPFRYPKHPTMPI